MLFIWLFDYGNLRLVIPEVLVDFSCLFFEIGALDMDRVVAPCEYFPAR